MFFINARIFLQSSWIILEFLHCLVTTLSNSFTNVTLWWALLLVFSFHGYNGSITFWRTRYCSPCLMDRIKSKNFCLFYGHPDVLRLCCSICIAHTYFCMQIFTASSFSLCDRWKEGLQQVIVMKWLTNIFWLPISRFCCFTSDSCVHWDHLNTNISEYSSKSVPAIRTFLKFCKLILCFIDISSNIFFIDISSNIFFIVIQLIVCFLIIGEVLFRTFSVI